MVQTNVTELQDIIEGLFRLVIMNLQRKRSELLCTLLRESLKAGDQKKAKQWFGFIQD